MPHCPSWTVRETFAHLAGVVDDAVHGNMAGAATDPWTAAQVAKRATVRGPDIAAEWAASGPLVDTVASQRGLGLAQLLFDTVQHEHDLRHALSRPGARDSTAMRIALHFVTSRLAERRSETGPWQLVVDGTPMFADVTGAAVHLRASMFDTVRSFGSRRSIAQIHALDWTGDPSPLVPAMLPFAPPADAIVE